MEKGMTRITGQVIYCGPNIAQAGLYYGYIFRDGIFEGLYEWIKRCPSMGALFVPVDEYAMVRKELNFDIARNMRGHSGKYVTLYREVQNWLATQAKNKQPETGVKLKHHV
jgi:hypothetical protein